MLMNIPRTLLTVLVQQATLGSAPAPDHSASARRQVGICYSALRAACGNCFDRSRQDFGHQFDSKRGGVFKEDRPRRNGWQQRWYRDSAGLGRQLLLFRHSTLCSWHVQCGRARPRLSNNFGGLSIQARSLYTRS